MWTLRIIESAACPRNEAYVLDMEQIAVLDREQLTVKIDDITLMDQNMTESALNFEHRLQTSLMVQS